MEKDVDESSDEMRGIEDGPQTVIQTTIQYVVATRKDIEFGVIEDLNCCLGDALKSFCVESVPIPYNIGVRMTPSQA
jgi:hypothetical protein